MGIIKNIKSLQGMGIYADRGARSTSLQFRRYNLVYGFNGSGKSTLSRLFASLEAGGPHPKLPAGGTFEVELDDGAAFGCPINPVGLEQRLLVFNSDYIEQNLQWAAGRANPVFYIGADQAEAANELTKVEGDIIQADAQRDKLKVETDGAAALREKARELRQRIRTHGPAAGVINKLIASYLGHGELTINPIDEGYELQRHGTPIAGAPSEGEKTAIAISYFLSSIEADNRKLMDVIVVIDDPVSSLDTKALNFACSLVRTRLEKAAQVFILTHNLQCMNEFRKAWKGRARPPAGKDPTATFLFIDVTMPEGQPRRSSKIIEMSKLLREYDSEYHFLFSHVLRFVEQPDAYDDHGYMIPNVIRRVLDVFLAFKCPGGGGLPGQLDKLCTDYPQLDREQLAALERLAQVESHSDNIDDLLSFSTMTLEETKGAAATLFDMIEKVDSKHIERLKSLCR
jgi:wobble nucleotide-excising tRNase